VPRTPIICQAAQLAQSCAVGTGGSFFAAADSMPLDRRRESHEQRLERTKAEIAARVARVCAGWPDGDLDALVTKMAEIEIRYEKRRRAEALATTLEQTSGV